jgi:sugar lactone lactonase YvrE
MVRQHAARVVADGLAFPECARWEHGRWWITDMHAGQVRSYAPDGWDDPAVEVDLGTDVRAAGIGWLPDGRLLVVSAFDATVRRREADGTVGTHADLRAATRGWCNDMLVDPMGRAYVGSYGWDLAGGEPRADVTLALVEPDGTSRTVGEPLAFPNGMARTPDGATLIVAESMADRLTAFTVAADGTLHDRRVWADLPDAGRPDGIALAPDGAVWVASISAGACVRVEAGGRITDAVTVPDRVPFACGFGGPDGATLLVCAARTHEHEQTVVQRGGVLAVASTSSMASSSSGR